MVDPRDKDDMKKGQQQPGREDDQGINKGARGTDSEKGTSRAPNQSEPTQTEKRK